MAKSVYQALYDVYKACDTQTASLKDPLKSLYGLPDIYLYL